MGIGNIGWTEFLVILAIALVFFGPRRLPGIAQAIGKSLREFQKALNEVKSEIAQASRETDVRTGAPYRPRDPLSLLSGLVETGDEPGEPTPDSAAAPRTGRDVESVEAVGDRSEELEVTAAPRVSGREAGSRAEGGGEPEGDDGDAGDKD